MLDSKEHTYDILDEEDPVAEAQWQLVEELDVLEQVVIAGPRVAVLVVVPVDQQLHRVQALLMYILL